MSAIIIFWSLALLHILQSSTVHGGTETTQRLVKDLFSGYNAIVRPNADDDIPVIVDIGTTLSGIDKAHGRSKVLEAHGHMALSWNDSRFQWDAAQYGNITVLRLPIRSLWRPDITFFNSADAKASVFSKDQLLAIVYANGLVIWVPKFSVTFRYKRTSSIEKGTADLKGEATLLLGSWTYSADDIDLRAFPSSVDTSSDFAWNSPYLVTNSTIIHKNVRYPCCKEGYPRLEIRLDFQKQED